MLQRALGEGARPRSVPEKEVILGRFVFRFQFQVSTRFQSFREVRLNSLDFFRICVLPLYHEIGAGRVFRLGPVQIYENAGCMDQATRERLKLLDEQIQKETDPEKVRQFMEESLRILDDLAKNNAAKSGA